MCSWNLSWGRLNKIAAEITGGDIETLSGLIFFDPRLISSVPVCSDQTGVKPKKIGPHGTKRLEVQVAIILRRQSDRRDRGQPGAVTARRKVPVGNSLLNGRGIQLSLSSVSGVKASRNKASQRMKGKMSLTYNKEEVRKILKLNGVKLV